MFKRNKISVLVCLLGAPFFYGEALAQFSGIYSPANFTLTSTNGGDGTVDTTSAPASVKIIGTDNGANDSTTSFSSTAKNSGTYSFTWTYKALDVAGPALDPARFVYGGTTVQLSNDSGARDQSGTVSYVLSKGTSFSFQIYGTDGILGPGWLTISNFLYPAISAEDTLASMQPNASGMRKIFSLQTSYANPGLSYDCSVFDKNDLCIAVTGRATKVSSSDIDAYSGVLTASYKVNPNIRVGGFIEQLTSDINNGGVKMQNNAPDFGVFGVWQEKEDAEGFKLRAAYRYGKKDMTITREQMPLAEAGSGDSKLTAQGLQLTLSNGFRLDPTVVISPYAGIRYVNIARNGYTETASDTVTLPLTYDKLRQELTSALVGASVDAMIAPQLTLNASAGIEYDMNQNIGKYQATGVDGLTPIEFDGNTNRTRAVASAGLIYAIDKTQAVSARVFYREEAYDSISTTTGLLTYSAGF